MSHEIQHQSLNYYNQHCWLDVNQQHPFHCPITEHHITCGDTSVNSIDFVTNSMDMDIDNDTDSDAAIDFAIGIVRLQRVLLLLLLWLLLLPQMFILTLRYTFLKW